VSQRAIRPKLACPLCGHGKSTVVPRPNRRTHGDVYDRVRECKACGCWYHTVERSLGVIRHPINKPSTSRQPTP